MQKDNILCLTPISIQNIDGKGGGLALAGGVQSPLTSSDYVDLEDCVVANCTASGNGGGLYCTINGNLNLYGTTTVENCSAADSWFGQFEGLGGGVHCSAGGYVALNDNTLVCTNTAYANGGGVSVKSATVTLNLAASIQGNNASGIGNLENGWGNGGGIYVTSCSCDGWPANLAATLFLNNGTLNCASANVVVQRNTAGRWGGGLYVDIPKDIGFVLPAVDFTLCSITRNVAGTPYVWAPPLPFSLLPSQIAVENVNCGVDFDGAVISGNPSVDIGIYLVNSAGIGGTPVYVPGTLAQPHVP